MSGHDPAGAPPQEAESPEEEKLPFSFILTIVMVSLYLGWRLVQGIIALVDWLS